jgi:hypothetical protein
MFLCLLSNIISLQNQFKLLVCFSADQIKEMDLPEDATLSSASSDEEVCFGDM